MSRKTNISKSELKDAAIRFIRVAGAGAIALLISMVAPLNTPESLLVVAVLVSVDKYFRDKGFYSTAVKTVLRK
jgi:hypothetical protein